MGHARPETEVSSVVKDPAVDEAEQVINKHNSDDLVNIVKPLQIKTKEQFHLKVLSLRSTQKSEGTFPPLDCNQFLPKHDINNVDYSKVC